MGKGRLYPALKRMEGKELIECNWKEEVTGKRKYYKITDKGKEALSERIT